MLKAPRKLRYKKIHRKQLKKLNRIRTVLTYQKQPAKLICTTSSIITAKQIEATRKNLSRKLKLISKLYLYVFPDLPLTAKPTAMRMGKGKGNFKEWIAKIKAGTPLFKIKGISLNLLKKILINKKINKFPFRVKLQ